MNALYFGACCGPFWARVPEIIGNLAGVTISPYYLLIGVIPAFVLPFVTVRAYRDNKWL